MPKKDKSIEIMDAVIQTASIIGPEKTKMALIDARTNAKYLDTSIIDLIKKHLCKTFKISHEKLMKGASKGARTEALMVGYVLAKKHLGYKLSDIALLFRKDKSNVSKSITAYNYLNDQDKNDKLLIENYQKISGHIIEFKNKHQWQDGN